MVLREDQEENEPNRSRVPDAGLELGGQASVLTNGSFRSHSI